MGGTGVIDRFLGVFTQYIDSGFGLVQGDVRWLAGVLIAIDITLAGLFWVLAPDEDVIARLIRKTLYIGVFAYIIANYNNLAQIIYNSFAGLGIKAGGGTLSSTQLLQPGRVAQVGIDAGQPILTSISGLMGFASFFDNFIQIAILLIAWLIVVISFFVMAIQLFVSLIEFKLTTLAGFVLVPFGLFGRTAFLAEKVLGNVVSSGVKILVLAVIIGIGSTIFGQFTGGFNNPPTINDALTLILASLAMLALVDLRAGHRQRLDRRRPAARRGRGRRDRSRGRRHRRRRRRSCRGRARRCWRLDRRDGAWGRERRRRRQRGLSREWAGRSGGSRRRGRLEPSASRRVQSPRQLCGRRERCDGSSEPRRIGSRDRLGASYLDVSGDSQPDRQPSRLRRRSRHPLRRSSYRRRVRRSLRRGIAHVSAASSPLRQDARA